MAFVKQAVFILYPSKTHGTLRTVCLFLKCMVLFATVWQVRIYINWRNVYRSSHKTTNTYLVIQTNFIVEVDMSWCVCICVCMRNDSQLSGNFDLQCNWFMCLSCTFFLTQAEVSYVIPARYISFVYNISYSRFVFILNIYYLFSLMSVWRVCAYACMTLVFLKLCPKLRYK